MIERPTGPTLKRWRESAGYTQEKLGELLQVTREWVGRLEGSERPVSANIWLRLQRLMSEQSFTAPVNIEEPQGEYLAKMGRRVPVLSWAHAGKMAAYEELPKDWQMQVFTECTDPESFAVEVEGDSMTPDYRHGDVIVVMPSQRPRNHSVVLAKLKNDGVVLKIFNLVGRENKTFRLSSLNPAYQPTDYIEDDFHWIYPVHSVVRMVWR